MNNRASGFKNSKILLGKHGILQLLGICAGTLLFAIPGKPEKFIHATTINTCLSREDKAQGIELKPIRILSPPTFRAAGEDFIEPLTGYQGWQPINRSDRKALSLIGTSGIERHESYYHSPLFYFLEQRVNSIQKKPRHSKDNFISKVLDQGNIGLNEYVYAAAAIGNPYFFARHVERSPVTLISFEGPRSKDDKCKVRPSIDITILQRGPGLSWGKAWSITLRREELRFIFHPKLKTLVSRYAPNTLKKYYFNIERSQVIILGLSQADPPLWIRLTGLLFTGILAISFIKRANNEWRPSQKLSPKGVLSRVALINILNLAFMIAVSAIALDFILANTRMLNGIDWYLPPSDLILSKRHLEMRQQQSNEYGFVDTKIDDYDTNNECKIAVLGDSFVWGWGTRPESNESWSRQLSLMIPNCRIFHWGQGGWSTNDQAKFMEENGHKHRVDLVLLGFVDNDLRFGKKNLEDDTRTITRLTTSLKGTPLAVIFTPWDGRNDQRDKFQQARDIFESQQIRTRSCLPHVQAVTGINQPAPRWMWSGNHVDSHPGHPITKAIARCAKEFLEQEIFSDLRINSSRR